MDDIMKYPPSMNDPEVYESLSVMGKMASSGAYAQVGCWLGASSIASIRGNEGKFSEYHLYDIWRAKGAEIEKAAAAGLTITVDRKTGTGDTLPLFSGYFYGHLDISATSLVSMVRVKAKDMTIYDGGPITMFVLDAAKRDPDFTRAMMVLGPHFVAGSTLIAFLDCYFYEKAVPELREQFKRQADWIDDRVEDGTFVPVLPRAGTGRFVKYVKPYDWWTM